MAHWSDCRECVEAGGWCSRHREEQMRQMEEGKMSEEPELGKALEIELAEHPQSAIAEALFQLRRIASALEEANRWHYHWSPESGIIRRFCRSCGKLFSNGFREWSADDDTAGCPLCTGAGKESPDASA